MIVTLNQFTQAIKDTGGNVLPIGAPIKSQARTAAGAFTALDEAANFIRVASNTAITLTDQSGNAYFFPANVPDYIGVSGKEVFNLAVV